MEIPKVNFGDLQLGNVLGEGVFGKVHLGTARAGPLRRYPQLAIKVLKLGRFIAGKGLEKEVNVYRKVGYHRNLVSLLGYCENENYCLIMEYVSVIIDGVKIVGLLQYLRHLKNKGYDSLRSRELNSFALQIAEGMEHLERHNVVHGDLAAKQILIGGSNGALILKICDFGLSRIPDQGGLPNVKDYIFSHEADRWSYGVLLWEIATLGEKPRENQIFHHSALKCLSTGMEKPLPSSISPALQEIIRQCWSHDRNMRPTFRELVQRLRRL